MRPEHGLRIFAHLEQPSKQHEYMTCFLSVRTLVYFSMAVSQVSSLAALDEHTDMRLATFGQADQGIKAKYKIEAHTVPILLQHAASHRFDSLFQVSIQSVLK